MSEWFVEVVKIGKIEKHPNADSLSITQILGGYPVTFRTGDYQEGDLAIYVPVDSIVPENDFFAFLGGHRRIKAKKIRGIFSQGMLIPISLLPLEARFEGNVVHEQLQIKKWLPQQELGYSAKGLQEEDPPNWIFPKYTDIEGLRRYKNVLQEGEEVVITEKLHGCNSRFVWDGERIWAGSRNQIKKRDTKTFWWKLVEDLDLESKLKQFPKTIFFGEIIGKSVQDLSYDCENLDFLVFDTFDVSTGNFNNWDTTVELSTKAGLKSVSVLYRGPWLGFESHASLAEGKSTLASHIREGFVVKPTLERLDYRHNRVIFKLVGETFLLRKS